MSRLILAVSLALLSLSSPAAELVWEYSKMQPGNVSTDFRSTVSGLGEPGKWAIVLDEIPTAFTSISPTAPALPKRGVLAQVARDSTDEHFPLLIYEPESFSDFSLTTRFKTVGGAVEQMAGIAFRIQDEKNYYVVRASSLGNTFRFYKFVEGQRSAPIGPEIEIKPNVWHELTVECKGNQIRIVLNGNEPIPSLSDTSFARGKIGFWTKSDAVSYFADTKITYAAQEILAKTVLRQALKRYPRVLALSIYAAPDAKSMPAVIASTDEADLGKPGQAIERDVIAENRIAYGKSNRKAVVTLPLHDRNGEAIAAVRVTMQSFPGQTEQNAIARALPIVKEMEAQVRSAKDLLE